jgi:hypothetical protein
LPGAGWGALPVGTSARFQDLGFGHLFTIRSGARAGLQAGLSVSTVGLPLGFLVILLPVVAVFAFVRGNFTLGLGAIGLALGAGLLLWARRRVNAASGDPLR